MEAPTIGWSKFAQDRHRKGNGYSYSNLSDSQVVKLVKHDWKNRFPGAGEVDLNRKVVVPLSFAIPGDFMTSLAMLSNLHLEPVHAQIIRRQPNEDQFIRNCVYTGSFTRIISANYVKVVCYSADALLENDGERSTDCDWEIVALLASDVENEPMNPLAMARNMLEKPGGTKGTYTAQEFAEAVYYWSQRVQIV